jgi:hypothetical protein
MADLAEAAGRITRRWAIVGAVVLAVLLLGVPVARPARALDENPPAKLGCGLPIALVVDRHTSSQASGWPGLGALRDQAKVFVAGLEGSGASVSLTSFADSAKVEAPATRVDEAGNAALQGALDGIAVTNGALAGSSNWQAGLLAAQSTFAGFAGGVPDQLVVISDSPANVDDGAGTPVPSAEAAADAIKAKGVHTYAVIAQGTALPFNWISSPPAAPIFGPRADALPDGDYFTRRANLVAEWLTLNVQHLCDGPTDSGAPNVGPALNACPADIAVVLDRRVTTQQTGWTTADNLRDQVSSFVGAIEGSGSTVSITSFADTATVEAPPTLVDASGRASLQASLDAIPMSDGPGEGMSNWEDALVTARSTFADFPDGEPDLLVMVTDSDPNAADGPGDPVARARTAADGVKSAGTHVYGLMPVGSSLIEVPPAWLVESPMVAVSGPNRGTSYLDDWELVVPSANRITGVLTSNLARLCLPVDANPDLDLPDCSAADVAFVIDRSGSIGATNLRLLKDGLHRTLDALAGTGSRVSITSYSTSAAVAAGATEVTTGANLDALHAAVDGLVSQGDTNWWAGLNTARSTFAGFAPAGHPDLVVHITDGEPTIGPDFATSIKEANAIKATGAHMLGVAIGSSVTAGNVVVASGPDRLPPAGFAQADNAIVRRFRDLGDLLVGGLDALCDATVTVHKLVEGVPTPGWSFTASSADAPDRGVTGEDGTVTFAYDLDFGGDPIATRIREVGQRGFQLLGVSCRDADDDLLGTAQSDGVELSVGRAARITCTFENVATTSAQPSTSPRATVAPAGGGGPGGAAAGDPGTQPEQELPHTGADGGALALVGGLCLALALGVSQLLRQSTRSRRPLS